jgi:hypothetical protein
MLVLAAPARAQSADLPVGAPPSADQDVRRADKVARAVPVRGPIELDGVLSEPAWAEAPPAGDFVQRQPVEGAAVQHPTEVRVTFDDHAIYVGARMYDDGPGEVTRQLVRRDEYGTFDWFEVSFDTNLDARTGYAFRVSADNVQRDSYLFDDSRSDDAWDAVWESAVAVDSAGWTAELRIPLSQIRFEAAEGPQTWGVHFNRRRVRSNEYSHFKLISATQEGVVSQFARLEGVRATRSARHFEVRPYLLSRASTGPAEAGDPFDDGSELQARVGGEVRVGLGPQFTLDATINPDFGQVEADPAVINLSAFETFFPERRPFFVEDARIFDFSLSGGRNQLFYSRRIGREPQGSEPDDAEFADVPEAATILGAAKLTGRTTGGLSVGALAALTQRETGRAELAPDGERVSFLAEPRAGYGVLRAVQELGGGASTIGAIATVTRRGLPDDGTFDFLPSSAISAGVDWEHQWNDREWAFFGYVAGTHVRGDTAAISHIQRSSDHYFQRPDARWVALDPDATTISGIDWRMTLERRRAEHWTGAVWLAEVTPGFDPDDIGFSNRQEVLDAGARVTYREIEPGDRLRSYRASLQTYHNWSHDALDDAFSAASWGRAHVGGQLGASVDLELLNYWAIDASASWEPEVADRTATRGGPLMLRPRSWDARFSIRTDRRRAVSLQPRVSYSSSALDAGSRLDLSLEASLRPTSRVEIELEPSWERRTDGAQYVTTSEALRYAPTFGARYVFADLERREVSLETRVNVAFSPDLSLQLFAQPLISTGDYLAYKQLVAPESFAFDVFEESAFAGDAGAPSCGGGRTCVDAYDTRYVDFDGDGAADDAFDDADFNVRSLVGNAVLRWEYGPGSTVFLVWQRQQRDRADVGDFAFGRDAGALFRSPADNVFMVKVNYWWTP